MLLPCILVAQSTTPVDAQLPRTGIDLIDDIFQLVEPFGGEDLQGQSQGSPVDISGYFDIKTLTGKSLGTLSPTNQIENCVKVKCVPVFPPGTTKCKWYKGTTYLTTTFRHLDPAYTPQWTGPTSFKLTAKFCDDAGKIISEFTKDVYVNGGMVVLSTMPTPGEVFNPACATFNGNQLWTVSASGRIGVAQLTTATALPKLTLMPQTVTQPYSAAYASGKLVVARSNLGINIYHADPDPGKFSLLKTAPASTFGCGAISRVCAHGDNNVIYVATMSPDQVRAYDISNPNLPVQVGASLAVTGSAMTLLPSGALVGHDGKGTLWVADVRVPNSPKLAVPAYSLGSYSSGLNASTAFRITGAFSSEQVVVTTGSFVTVLDLFVPAPLSQAISLGNQRAVVCASPVAPLVWSDRVYAVDPYWIYKYDAAPSPTYFMEKELGQNPSIAVTTLWDSDGPFDPTTLTGALDPVLLLGHGSGFRAVSR
jgi:hypothetical protein